MTAKPNKPRDVRTYGEETRGLVLTAAEKLFATQGLHDTSMQDIAEEAKVSRATVFNQFGSKQLVLDAITARSLQSYCDLLSAALADERTPAPRLLTQLFDQMGRGIETNRALYREVFTEIRKVSMGLDGAGQSPLLREKAFRLLADIFRRGQKRGEIASAQPADVLATAYDSLLSGAVIQWLHDPRKGSLRPMLAALADVFLRGAGA